MSASTALGASAEAVLRRLEAWAQADASAEEEASEEGPAAVVATGTLDGELALAAAPRGGAPPGGPAPHAPVALSERNDGGALRSGSGSMAGSGVVLGARAAPATSAALPLQWMPPATSRAGAAAPPLARATGRRKMQRIATTGGHGTDSL